MGTKLRKVQSLAGQALKDSTDSYNLALNIYQQAFALQVPEVNNQELEDKASKVCVPVEYLNITTHYCIRNKNIGI